MLTKQATVCLSLESCESDRLINFCIVQVFLYSTSQTSLSRVVYFGASSANLTDGVLNMSRRSRLFGFEIALDLTFSSTKIGFPLMEFWTPRAIDLTFHGIHMKERSVRTPQDATKKRVGNVQNKTCRSSCRLSSSGRPGASKQHGF